MHADRAKDKQSKATEGLILGPGLGVVFLGLSFLRIIGDATSAMFGGDVRVAPLEQSIWGMQLAWRLAGFAGALILLYLLLGIAAWGMAWLSRRAWPGSGNSQRVWTCLWMVLAVIWVLAANAAWFPSSSLGNPYAGLVQMSFAGLSLFDVMSVALAVAVGMAVAGAIWRHRRAVRSLPAKAAVPGVIMLLAAVLMSMYLPMASKSSATAAMGPNIILIGLDSVRSDVAREANAETVPFIGGFLREATVFPDTTTPLARTFAAWVSILTGRHPHTTGATVNLLPKDLIETGETLPEVLRDAGYRTVYGIDEVRFSNIDESYGFDKVVGPRMGSADFLVEFFGDTPLSNLLVNTRLGDALFPELHGNRAAEVVYDPDTFIRDLERELRFDSPTFLAAHLTLAHWPYTWARSEPGARGTMDASRFPELYAAALERLDRQFTDLMVMLERKGALDDAIVIVLSDHGESLGELSPLSGSDGQISPLLGRASVYGHGTHVFSGEQYGVLLALRSYGDTPIQLAPGRRIPVPASLEDITPTLLDALQLESADPFDGRSLLPYLRDSEDADFGKPERRIRFLETEYNPPGVSVEIPMTASALAKASASYRIDAATDRVEVRPDHLPWILNSRQYAAVLGDHLLAAIPSRRLDSQHLIYAGPGGGGPVWLDEPPSVAGTSIEQELWIALRNRFEPVATRPVVAVSSPEE